MKGLAATFILFLLIAGHEPPASLRDPVPSEDSIVAVVPQAVVIPVPDTLVTKIEMEEPAIQTGSLNPLALVAYSKTLIGIPYVYGSTDPKKGFDCSGFITYVFNHFKVKVPRSSVEFTDVGKEINYQVSKPGDLILFTGTDSAIRTVGHMGIVVNNENNKLFFIHSTSGKKLGVTITELSPYYMSRFVRVARIFPEASYSIASSKRENEGYIEGRPTNESPKSPGTKKSSKLKTSKKVDSSKSAKSNSTVKKAPTKGTTSGTSKSPAVKKSSVKKPATTTFKSTKKTPAKKKNSAPQKTSSKTVS
jgi:NlpC/P60 family